MDRTGIERIAAQKDAKTDIVEKDYVLSVALSALSKHKIANKLIFKGGTAIKKAYYPDDARFSTDLDFTAFNLQEPAIIAALQNLFEQKALCDIQFQGVKTLGTPETASHYQLFYTGFLGTRYSIKFDFMQREPGRTVAKEQPIHMTYPDAAFHCGYLGQLRGLHERKYMCRLHSKLVDMEECVQCRFYVPPEIPVQQKMRVMSLKEIFSEKIRSIIDPTRKQARDLYDIQYLLRKEDEMRAENDMSNPTPEMLDHCIQDPHLLKLINIKLALIEKKFDYEEFCQSIDALEDQWKRDFQDIFPKSLPNYEKIAKEVKERVKHLLKS